MRPVTASTITGSASMSSKSPESSLRAPWWDTMIGPLPLSAAIRVLPGEDALITIYLVGVAQHA